MMTAIIVLLSIAFLVCGVLAILFFTKNKNLNSKLAQEKARNEDLSVEVKSLEQAKADLDGDLKQEKQRNARLEDTKAKALQTLYLLQLLLKASFLQFLQVQDLYKDLGGNYRQLAQEYEDLAKHYQNNVEAHDKFREEIQRKAKRRVFQKAGSAALSLIPGFGVVDLLGSLTDVISDAADFEVADALSDVKDLSELASWEVLKNFDLDIAAFRDLSIEEESASMLSEDARLEIVEAIKQHFRRGDVEIPELNWNQIDNLIQNVIQDTGVSLQLTSGQGNKAVEDMFTKFKDFVTEACDYGKTHSASNGEVPGGLADSQQDDASTALLDETSIRGSE